jgi:RNA polymerase sigma-70 factor (ECF subfamily)
MTDPAPSQSCQPRVPGHATDAVLARDREWVARIRQGDIAAFEAMYRTYKNDLGAFLESFVRSREAAEEIIQDLFVRLWEQRDLWEFQGALNTYLFRAARNRAISYLRHERVATRFLERRAGEVVAEFDSVRQPGADEACQANELEAAVDRAVEALPERCREVFRLNRYHGLSYAEVAQAMQISVKTVEVQMGRALTALRRRLAVWRE